MLDNLQEILDQSGVFQHGFIDTDKIIFREEVRKMCEVNTCGKYGQTWACPPAIGTLEECKQKCLEYDKMLVFSAKYDLEDSFDFEGMTKGMDDFKAVAKALEKKIKPYLKDYLILANEGCGMCNECTYPDSPCRFPDEVHGSIEGYGLLVTELAKMVGINYINGANTVTYFGGLLYKHGK